MAARILIVDDDADIAELARDGLRRRGFDVEYVTSAPAALEWLATHPFDVVVTDVLMSGMSGIELCELLRERFPDVVPIVITGHTNLDTAVAAIRAGAYDFITKPLQIEPLVIAVERAVERQFLRREVTRLETEIQQVRPVPEIVGNSAPVRRMIELIRKMADGDASVLIEGESGTGKELVARALHQLSPRRDKPFVAVNCAAVPATLLESELFGHERGAFTDAKKTREGLFVRAHGGTLFLDEIGEMPLEMQVKLLRALQERTVRPVGSDEETPFDARIVTATNRDLETELSEKRFREDLYYRINVVTIVVPPLRARGGDVLLLAQYFLNQVSERVGKAVEGISPEAARKLIDYDWPGNVRELENSMERAVALSRYSQITVADLPAKVAEHQSSRMVIATDSPAELITLAELERRYVRQVLAATGGNKSQTARVLGIDRRSLYRRLDRE
ncbi:MAG TPA: sigma-54 dependent transcriptional regulator [Kofleriaceae bacterium]|nr:sigma-54 dependent transcriptional regulator [Kofleriaceae bacterium]